MQGKAHADAVRAEVMAALLAGQGVNEVARKYRLPKSTVSRIKNGLLPEQLEQLGTEKKETLDTLLLGAVEANVGALTRIAQTASEPDYIRKQSAESVGILYGILADKAIRFLEAASLGDATAGQSGTAGVS